MAKGQPNEALVKYLDPSSPFLSLLHQMFYDKFAFEDSQIICIFETKETATVEVSSLWTLLYPNENNAQVESLVVYYNQYLGKNWTESHDGA